MFCGAFDRQLLSRLNHVGRNDVGLGPNYSKVGVRITDLKYWTTVDQPDQGDSPRGCRRGRFDRARLNRHFANALRQIKVRLDWKGPGLLYSECLCCCTVVASHFRIRGWGGIVAAKRILTTAYCGDDEGHNDDWPGNTSCGTQNVIRICH